MYALHGNKSIAYQIGPETRDSISNCNNQNWICKLSDQLDGHVARARIQAGTLL